MDFTVLVTVLLIVVVVPIRNKIIRKFRDKKKQIKILALSFRTIICLIH